ncbi:MAG: hypothetical protein ABIO71_05525 [Caldimonas sp.]
MRPSIAATGRAGLVFLLLTGIAVAADAADKSPPRAAAAARPGDRVLTPAQLRECLAHKERVRGDADAAGQTKTELAAVKADIDRSGTELAEVLATLDKTSAEAVDAYNARVDRRDRVIDDYQARVTAYNTRAEVVLASRAAYEKACENRRYDERDLDDLKRKK